jgi:hypothetical protein
MKKVKVRIYKDPNGKGEFINPTKKFLQKAAAGMQVGQDMMSLEDRIVEELKNNTTAEDIADILEAEYGVKYYEGLNMVDDVINYVYDDYANDIKNAELSDSELIPEEEEAEPVKKPPLYNIDEPWVSEEDPEEGWDDFGEDSGEEDEDAEEEEEEDLSSNKSKQPKSAQQQQQSPFNDLVNRQPNTGGSFNVNKLFPNPVHEWRKYVTPVNKKGGNVNKGKFVKSIVRGLHKAAEGVEQQANESSILDTPIKGREAHINNFRRGIKNLGNEFYAKQIFDQTQELNNQVRSLPPMAQDGMEMQQQDVENPMHHLEAYTGSVSNIFKEPMNQVHGAGYEMPQARKGREQRQAERQQRNVGKDFRKMFGDMAVGYAGVPGMPNYIQMITPQIQTGQGAPQGSSTQGTQGSTGPGIDFEYKKGPWWTGRREWSAKGIPAEMMMGMIGGGGGRGMRPGAYYGPGRTSSSSSWNTSWSSPGEIIREKVKTVNSQADPAKNNTTNLNNNSAVEAQRKKYQEYIDDYNNETVTDPIGAGMSKQAPISFEEFIAKDADGLSEYDYWLKRSPGTTTSSTQLNPNSSYSKTSSAQTIPGLIDYGQDWAGNVAKSEEMYKDFNKKENLLYYAPEDPSQYGYMIDPATGEVVKNPKGTDVDQRGLVWSGKYDDENTGVDESLVWSNPMSPEEWEKNRSYENDRSYIITNPDGTQSSVMGIQPGSEFSPWNIKMEEATNARIKAAEQQASYIANIPKDVRAKNYKEINKGYGLDILDANGNFLKGIESFSLEENPVMDYDFIQKQFGGPISGASPDEYGNLQKFIYGGDEDIPISPIVAYDNNDIQSKNVDDPFMFRNGGLYKFAGPNDSETNPYNLTNPTPNAQTTNTVGPYQTPAFNRYNSKATSASNFAAFDQMKRAGLIQGNYDPTKTYDLEKTQQQNQNQNQNQNQTQGGYPTAPSPMRQIFDMFNPIKKDFTYLTQRDYARTADGQIYNPQGQGQNQGQGQGTTTQDQTQGQTNPAKAGYYYDVTRTKKGPFWKRENTLTLKGKWIDPNNPNAGAAQPGSGNTQNNVSTNNAAPNNWHAPMVLPGTETQTANTATTTPYVSTTSSTTPEPPRKSTAEKYGFDEETWSNMSWRDQTDAQNAIEDQSKAPTRPITVGAESMQRNPEAKGYNPMFMGSGTLNQGAAPADNAAPAQRPNISFPQNQSGPPVNEQGIIRRQYGGYMPEYMAYGGYMPSYQGGGTNAGSGPFDPNVSGIADGGIGPCTEQQVLNAAPGDPCYNEGYSKGQGTPQDFEVSYDVKNAYSLRPKAISNIKNLAGFGLRANAGRKEMNYNKDYLADNTTSDNKEAANELDYTGGYSGLNQRIMSKSGAGATGFNRVVGEAAFVKRGGELKYQKGGVYDLTQEEIGQILAAGGQIKFIK